MKRRAEAPRTPLKRVKSEPGDVRRSPRQHVGSLRRSPRKHSSSSVSSRRIVKRRSGPIIDLSTESKKVKSEIGSKKVKSEVERKLGEVESYFQQDGSKEFDDNFLNTVDPQCWDCRKPIRSKADCFPKGSWGNFDQVLFRCKSCYEKHCADLQVKTQDEAKERQKLKDEIKKKKSATPKPTTNKKSATPKKTTTKKSATPNKTTTKKKSATPNKTTTKKSATPNKTTTTKKSATPNKTTFEVGDNVLAKWKDGKRYPAQIFGVENNKFNVYFPQDKQVRLSVNKSSLSRPRAKAAWAQIKRTEYVGMDSFKHDQKRGLPNKFGEYTPVGVGTGKNINKYICKSTRKGDDTNYLFDMGYVQLKLLLKSFPYKNAKGVAHDKDSLYK